MQTFSVIVIAIILMNSNVNLSFALDKIKKVKNHIRIGTHKSNVLRSGLDLNLILSLDPSITIVFLSLRSSVWKFVCEFMLVIPII